MKKYAKFILLSLLVSVSAIGLVGCPTGGGTMANAIELVLGTSYSDVLTRGAVQYFKFTAKKDTLYEVLVKLDFPMMMSLLKEDGTIVMMSQQNDLKTVWPEIVFDADGVYYLRLEAATNWIVQYPALSDTEMAAYDIVVRETTTMENVAEDKIQTLTEGTPVPDQELSLLDNQKFYKVVVPATEPDKDPVLYWIAVEVAEFGMGARTQLYDEDKQPIGSMKRISDREYVTTGAQPTTYYVQVSIGGGDAYDVVVYTVRFEKAPLLNVTGAPEEPLPASPAGTFDLQVTNAGSGNLGGWFAYVNDWSGNNWLHITSGSEGNGPGTITLAYDAQTNCYQRGATVVVVSEDGMGQQNIQINQNGTQVTLSETEREVPVTAGTFTVNVVTTAGVPWTAQVSGWDSGWLRITSGASGTGPGTITFVYDANSQTYERNVWVYVTQQGGCMQQAQLNVAQEAADPQVAVSPTAKTVMADGETFQVSVTNSGTGTLGYWYANSDDYWAQITSNTSGNGPGSITVTCDANEESYPRSTTIYINSDNAGQAQVTINQAAGS
ncbi:MAG: large repetitive protein [Candidatus Hydrogenedentes bacterium]|nr:large repetitive protein [Candidatus Hydrogenedentota bacterium]